MNCWICGSKGNSGEHLIKASDIKSLFSDITQKNPVYYHNEEKKNIPVGSSKSDRFKSEALICSDCNNNKTAPHDHAWQKLSEHLRTYSLYKRGPLKIRLSKVFHNEIYNNSINVHLYFVKLFGCRIIESEIPIEIESFSKAILNNEPNPYVFIHFKKAIGSRLQTLALTPVHLEHDGKNIIVAAWMYAVGDLNIEILYSPSGACSKFLKKSFHPACRHKLIDFIDFIDFEEENDEI